MATQQIPPLPSISLSTLDALEPPVTRIKTDDDVETWRTTSGYQNLLLFIHHLSNSVVGHDLPTDEDVEDSVSSEPYRFRIYPYITHTVVCSRSPVFSGYWAHWIHGLMKFLPKRLRSALVISPSEHGGNDWKM
jgi:hypothetical protein